MKKIVGVVLSLALVFSFSTAAFAMTTGNPISQTIIHTKNEHVFGMDAAPGNKQDKPALFATFEGNAGTSTLDYLDRAREMHWSVHPATTLPYVFIGEIQITTLAGKVMGTIYFSEEGTGNITGQETLNGVRGLRTGTNYIATLYGSATDAMQNVYTVSPSAHIAFMYGMSI